MSRRDNGEKESRRAPLGDNCERKGEATMSKESPSDRPKIHVRTPRGGLYVKADELLRSKKARAIIDKAAKLALKRKASDGPVEDRSEKPK